MNRIFKYALTLAAMSTLFTTPAFAQTDVHILDVGQGLSILVESQGHAMLYDGGDRNKSSFVVSYLKDQDIKNFDYVIASHYDSDHLNGVVGALNVFSTKQVFAPEYTTDTRVFNSFTSIVKTRKIPKKQPAVGSKYQLGDATIQILSPSGSDYSDVNNYSIAVRIVDGDTSFLITGDAEAQAEKEICSSKLELDSDVYVMGHHGSGSSTSWDLLQKVTPEYAVVSCGTGNSYGHPHVESMEKLQSMDIQLLRTDKQGTLIASTDGKTIKWNVEPCNDYTPGDSNDKAAAAQTQNPESTQNSAKAPNSVKTQNSAKAQNSSESQSSTQKSDTSQETKSSSLSTSTEYILNTSTKKIHLPNCKSVKQMKDKNKKSTTESKASLMSQGYTPCGNCNP